MFERSAVLVRERVGYATPATVDLIAEVGERAAQVLRIVEDLCDDAAAVLARLDADLHHPTDEVFGSEFERSGAEHLFARLVAMQRRLADVTASA